MTHDQPLVSIGLPVYNGANYIDVALDALRNQTYQNMEIIISDNASEDETETICRAAAAEDDRIRYIRQPENLGASPNHNEVLKHGRGKYFVWAAHDDLHDPKFVEVLVGMMEENPDAMSAFSRSASIDPEGNLLKHDDLRPDMTSPDPVVRFRHILDHKNTCHPFFAVHNREKIMDTRLFLNFTGADRIMLAEILLRGPILEHPETLFYLRHHEGRSTALPGKMKTRWGHPREGWFDPSRATKIVFPAWKRLGKNITAVMQAPISFVQKIKCVVGIAHNLSRRRFMGVRALLRDFPTAGSAIIARMRH